MKFYTKYIQILTLVILGVWCTIASLQTMNTPTTMRTIQVYNGSNRPIAVASGLYVTYKRSIPEHGPARTSAFIIDTQTGNPIGSLSSAQKDTIQITRLPPGTSTPIQIPQSQKLLAHTEIWIGSLDDIQGAIGQGRIDMGMDLSILMIRPLSVARTIYVEDKNEKLFAFQSVYPLWSKDFAARLKKVQQNKSEPLKYEVSKL